MSTEEFSSMEKKVTLNWLLAFYGNLLTDIQWEMARLYWEEDYSLAEIADFRGRRRETEREGRSEAAARDAANEKEAGA